MDNILIKIPQTWEELKKLVDILPFCGGEVTRLPQDKEFYESYTRALTQEQKVNNVYQSIGDNQICFLINNYPYTRLLQNLPNVKHYCLWSRTGALSPTTVEQEIQKKFFDKDYFWFENDVNIKSIPEIWHCHVFIQKNLGNQLLQDCITRESRKNG